MTAVLLPTREEIEAAQLYNSLGRFVRAAWPVVEQGAEFIPNWHIDAICHHLELITRGEIQRLIINIPPRHMKSLAVTVFWPCWEWLRRPETHWLFASCAQELSIRDSLKCRRLLTHPGSEDPRRSGSERTLIERIGYPGVVQLLSDMQGEEPWELTADQSRKQRFENSRTGYRIATSVGPAEHHGRPVLMVQLVQSEGGEAGQRAVAPFRALAEPLADMFRPMRYPEMFELSGPSPFTS